MSSQQPRRIVVVDDGSMRQALARILRLAGYCVSTFSSAEELLEANTAATTDCLVLDVYLPNLTGLELYEKLAAEAVSPPVIFVSAYEEPDLARVRTLGRASFLGKPFLGKTLLEEVARALDAPEGNSPKTPPP